MNSTRNILLNARAQASAKDLFKIACEVAKSGKVVFYVLAKPLEALPFDDDDPLTSSLLDRNILRNIIFKYLNDPTTLVKVLFELHTAQMKPQLIIIDFLHTFFGNVDNLPSANIKEEFYRDFVRKHMLIIAAVQNTIETLSKCLKTDCSSIVCLDTSANKAYNRFKQTIVDLYYFRENVIFNSSIELTHSFECN